MSRRDPRRRWGDASDVELATAASGGDREALDQLLERHFDRIHAICRRVTADADDALDATQEALVSVARRIDTYDGRAKFTTWLYRVAVNAALDELRRRKRRPSPQEQIPEHPNPTFETSVDARIDVDSALARIAPDYRAAVVLRDLCDLEYDDIATILDVPIGTVRSRIARGRRSLADQIATRSGNPAPGSRRPITEEP